MRKIEAIVQSDRLPVLRKALVDAGVFKMTVTEVREYSINKPHTEIYRSDAFSIDSIPRVKVETIVQQKMVKNAVSVLMTIGHAGKGGEDKIFISTVNDIVQLSPEEPDISI